MACAWRRNKEKRSPAEAPPAGELPAGRFCKHSVWTSKRTSWGHPKPRAPPGGHLNTPLGGEIIRKRNHQIALRLNERELRHLDRQSELSGLSREEYLRTLIMGAELHPRPCTHHADLLRKVAGLCNNANQLAHRANSTGVAGQESVDKMPALAAEVYRVVKENW